MVLQHRSAEPVHALLFYPQITESFGQNHFWNWDETPQRLRDLIQTNEKERHVVVLESNFCIQKASIFESTTLKALET